jgi:hypothetical protein
VSGGFSHQSKVFIQFHMLTSIELKWVLLAAFMTMS